MTTNYLRIIFLCYTARVRKLFFPKCYFSIFHKNIIFILLLFQLLKTRRVAPPSLGQGRTPLCSLLMKRLWSTTLHLMQGTVPSTSYSARICINQTYNFFCHYSAVIEHTNRVIFLEDDDVAVVVDGRLSIHRIKRTAGDYPARAIQTLQMELQQIMKGKCGFIHSSADHYPFV